MTKILFFDFDGTIADTYRLCYENFIFVLGKYNCRIGKDIRELLGYKLPEILRKLRIRGNLTEKIEKEFFKILLKKIDKLKSCVSLKPLKSLSKKYKMFVISNSKTFFIKASLKKFGIYDLFTGIYGADRFSSKDKIIKRILKQHRVKPGGSVYIGDKPSDIECAKKAGCIAVVVHNKCSWASLSQVKKAKPDFIIKDFSELKKVLKKIDTKKQ